MTTIYNWSPVIGSFVHTMLKDGWKATNVTDFQSRFIFIEEATLQNVTKKAKEVCGSVDESSMTFKKGDLGVTAYILLGNDPEEMIGDWGYKDNASDEAFHKSWRKFTAKWEGKKCPTKEVS